MIESVGDSIDVSLPQKSLEMVSDIDDDEVADIVLINHVFTNSENEEVSRALVISGEDG